VLTAALTRPSSPPWFRISGLPAPPIGWIAQHGAEAVQEVSRIIELA
jgi:hypothetical protein